MEITGRLLNKLDVVTGEGKNGPWKKQDFILETQDQYPKKVCITVWGDKINLENFAENETVTVSINVESREYNSRWYTDVKAWKMDKAGAGDNQAPDYGIVPPDSAPPPEPSSEPTDDLPF
ncbi:MAG: hypothetical protein DRJ05_06985 [Bacteroidetes bacterium]|nr:MAG: hypothetical protein DRJ05_06985 [Bacteroidota bacterium]